MVPLGVILAATLPLLRGTVVDKTAELGGQPLALSVTEYTPGWLTVIMLVVELPTIPGPLQAIPIAPEPE